MFDITSPELLPVFANLGPSLRSDTGSDGTTRGAKKKNTHSNSASHTHKAVNKYHETGGEVTRKKHGSYNRVEPSPPFNGPDPSNWGGGHEASDDLYGYFHDQVDRSSAPNSMTTGRTLTSRTQPSRSTPSTTGRASSRPDSYGPDCYYTSSYYAYLPRETQAWTTGGGGGGGSASIAYHGQANPSPCDRSGMGRDNTARNDREEHSRDQSPYDRTKLRGEHMNCYTGRLGRENTSRYDGRGKSGPCERGSDVNAANDRHGSPTVDHSALHHPSSPKTAVSPSVAQTRSSPTSSNSKATARASNPVSDIPSRPAASSEAAPLPPPPSPPSVSAKASPAVKTTSMPRHPSANSTPAPTTALSADSASGTFVGPEPEPGTGASVKPGAKRGVLQRRKGRLF